MNSLNLGNSQSLDGISTMRNSYAGLGRMWAENAIDSWRPRPETQRIFHFGVLSTNNCLIKSIISIALLTAQHEFNKAPYYDHIRVIITPTNGRWPLFTKPSLEVWRFSLVKPSQISWLSAMWIALISGRSNAIDLVNRLLPSDSGHHI